MITGALGRASHLFDDGFDTPCVPAIELPLRLLNTTQLPEWQYLIVEEKSGNFCNELSLFYTDAYLIFSHESEISAAIVIHPTVLIRDYHGISHDFLIQTQTSPIKLNLPLLSTLNKILYPLHS
ncbi:hypothetical protein ANAPH1_00469 [Anaplasma phagocytophilum]|nr:hypothetical protein ANAPH1_00469 [Anaplasma phagocytophilum]